MPDSLPVNAPVRIAISKKSRFEIFKRDGFTCQYCGAHPPKVILHVDHIQAVVAGGSNDRDNLVTACQDCNQGKGARALDATPQSLAERAALVKEAEAQLAGFQRIFRKKEERLRLETIEIVHLLWPNRQSLRTDWFRSIRHFISLLGLAPVSVAADITRARMAYLPVRSDGSFVMDGEDRYWRYFCGVCWRKIKGEDRA